MSTNLLAAVIFIISFGIVILVHEFGHFFVGRFFNVEVEEFGIGIPPKMFTFWREKGSFEINGQRIEIPTNFKLPARWQEVANAPAKITVDKVDTFYILRTIETEITDPFEPEEEKASTERKKITAGEESGTMKMEGTIRALRPGTDFTFNWLPLGGFNRFKGENDPDVGGGLADSSPLVRISVLVAGAIMNLILGIFVYSIIISQIGLPNVDIIEAAEVTPGSPAAQAGIQENDIFLEIDNEAINDISQLRALIAENMDTEIPITLQRGEEIIETSATPLSSRTTEEGALGFIPGYTYSKSPSLIETVKYGSLVTFFSAREILLLPGKLISGEVSGDQGRFLGFKSIFGYFNATISADMESRAKEPVQKPAEPAPLPTFYTWELIASLTITIGVFNLLPFPALDGGRIFFIIPELLFRKRVPPEFENVVHGVGMMLLLGFMLYINVMDFVNPVAINLP